MKKVSAISLVLFGVVFLAGCSQQPVSQTEPTLPDPETQQAIAQPTLPDPETQQSALSVLNSPATLEIYKNSVYGYEITLPASWKAYSESDGKVIASSPSKFPQNPLILTGTPPALDFQIEVVANNDITSYVNSFLSDAVKVGSKYIRDGKVFYLAQNRSSIVKIFSSNSNYDKNDAIFNSLKLAK